MALVITLHLTGDMFCWSKVAEGRGFLLPFVFHDDWQSLCLVIDLWLLSKSWLFSSCVYVLLWKLGVIIPGLVGSQNNEIEFISCDWTFFGILCLYLSKHFSQSVVITLSRFWANTVTLFKTQIPSMENMLQLFLDSLIQFQSVILNIIRICLSVSAHFSLWGLLHLWSDSADPGLHSGEAVLHKTQCCLNLLMLWCWSWNWAGDLCFVLTLPRQGFTLQCLIDSE